jgi:enoyl-CoA hydratase/carnithine racemase
VAEFVSVQSSGGLATIRLDRPPVNALSIALQGELRDAAKQAIDTGLDVSLDDGLEIERLHFAALFATEDQKLGMESFVASGPGKAMFTGT